MAIVTPFIETKGGLERIILKIAKHFNAKIYCVRYDPEKTFPGFKDLEIELKKPTFVSKLPLGKRVTGAIEAGEYFYNLKLEGYDVIVAFQAPSEWIRNNNSPVIWYCNSPNREAFDLYDWRMKRRNPFSKLIFWLSIKIFKYFEFKTVPKIEHIFANSMNVTQRISKYLKRQSEPLYLGIDSQKFRYQSSEKFFFYPSRIAPEKDFEYAIEAFRIFSQRVPGWKFVIAGSLSDRPEHQAYLRTLRSKCDNSIIIETNITEERLIELYARCYAVVFTPINEDFGLVPLEAMASSKPCISKNEGGPKETIAHGRDGFLVPSIWKLAQAMEWMSKNPEKVANMGRAGKMKVEKDFTWEKFLRRFEEKTHELIVK